MKPTMESTFRKTKRTKSPRYRYYRIHHITKNSDLTDVTLHTRILKTRVKEAEVRATFPPIHGFHVEQITAHLAKNLIDLYLQPPLVPVKKVKI